jgi:hypothetical protein
MRNSSRASAIQTISSSKKMRACVTIGRTISPSKILVRFREFTLLAEGALPAALGLFARCWEHDALSIDLSAALIENFSVLRVALDPL